MGIFKRLCLLVFGVAGLAALAALCLPWVGPWTVEAASLINEDWYFQILQVLVLITGVGLLVCLLRALFTRNRKTVTVSREGGDQITVTRDAIASQARHVVEDDGRFVAKRVRVKAKKRGHVRVSVRIQPTRTVDVVAAGGELHDRLVSGLMTVCGDNVDSVGIEFLEADEYEGEEVEPLATDTSFQPAAGDPTPTIGQESGTSGEEPTQVRPEPAPEPTGEIVVPMGRADRGGDEDETGGEQ
jgi:hypothetical protein